jgi:hypothetical protein
MAGPPVTAHVAIAYHGLGWHPIELPAGAKAPPPEGRTGYGGSDLTEAEVRAAEWAGNVGLRMPPDVIGLDVDAYHGGDVTLTELLARCGKLPNTWIAHSGRNDGSGIRFYRVPVGLAWVASLAGIELIQRIHRYAVVYPSIHPDGRAYGWVDQNELAFTEELPIVEDLPELPWPWIAELSRARPADVTSPSKAVDGDELDVFLAEHNQADQPSYAGTILAHFTQRWQAGHSRHDTMQHCLIWAMECVRAGVAAGRPTVDQFARLWVEAVLPDTRRAQITSPARTTEFEAMLRHAVGKVRAKPDAEMVKFHDDIAGVPMNVTSPNGQADAVELAVVERLPTITFRDLPDPFVIPTITWHAENLLCRDTHGELAGAEKSFKSYLGLCLDVALAAGLDVLGYFPVTERQRVLILVGEGGEGPFLRRLAEVCAGYGITPDSLHGWLRFTTDHASASTSRFLDGINHELETWRPALVHADPWYAYQPSTTESSQLTSIGAALEKVGDLCRQGGATALINHHFNRGVNGGLRQITGAGHAEWVDSWLLTGHREPPDLAAGYYRVRLDVGSRQWGGGSYDIDFRLSPAPFGRLIWAIRPAVDVADTDDPLDAYKAALLEAGRALGEEQTRTAWIQRTKGDDKKLRPAFDELVRDGRILPGSARDLWLPVPLLQAVETPGDDIESSGTL